MPRAFLIAPAPRAVTADRPLNVVDTYRYDTFALALGEEGLETAVVGTWPDAAAADYILFHTMGIDHEPMRAIEQRYGSAARARAIPLMTALPGALHAVIKAGAPAAIEREGYSRWARGEEARGEPSGLVMPAARAAASGLPVLETYAGAVLIEAVAPLPHLLIRALGIARAM